MCNSSWRLSESVVDWPDPRNTTRPTSCAAARQARRVRLRAHRTGTWVHGKARMLTGFACNPKFVQEVGESVICGRGSEQGCSASAKRRNSALRAPLHTYVTLQRKFFRLSMSAIDRSPWMPRQSTLQATEQQSLSSSGKASLCPALEALAAASRQRTCAPLLRLT